jgi:hypothetical protein
MPLMTSTTTSASGTRPRDWRQMARGKTVPRPPKRCMVRSPRSSLASAPLYEPAITVTRWPQSSQRETCPYRLVPVPPPWGWVQSRSVRTRMCTVARG